MGQSRTSDKNRAAAPRMNFNKKNPLDVTDMFEAFMKMKLVEKGDMETYQQIVDFIEQQEDINGKPIENEIDTRESLRSSESYKGEGSGAIDKGGNTFFWEN